MENILAHCLTTSAEGTSVGSLTQRNVVTNMVASGDGTEVVPLYVPATK